MSIQSTADWSRVEDIPWDSGDAVSHRLVGYLGESAPATAAVAKRSTVVHVVLLTAMVLSAFMVLSTFSSSFLRAGHSF